MRYDIIWTSEAVTTFEERIEYLTIHWTEKEISKFKARVRTYLETLSETPYIGKKPGRLKNVYMGLILKQVSIIYRVKSNNKQIELLSFIDNRRDPKKIRKYKPL